MVVACTATIMMRTIVTLNGIDVVACLWLWWPGTSHAVVTSLLTVGVICEAVVTMLSRSTVFTNMAMIATWTAKQVRLQGDSLYRTR